MTISSSAALPARSPMPLMVHSTWRAPARTPASELATARPRSLWQWVEKIDLVAARHAFAQHRDELEIFLRRRIADGVGDIDRSWRRIGSPVPRSGTGNRAPCAWRLPALHCTSSVMLRARATDAPTASSTAFGPICSLCFMCTGLVEMKVWMRKRFAGLQCFAGAIDILEAGAREAADHRVLRALGDFLHRFEIAVRGNRETRLDHIDAHRIEQFGDFDFFLAASSQRPAIARRRAMWCRRFLSVRDYLTCVMAS